MKRFLFTILLGVFAWSGYCQDNVPESYGYDDKYYKDRTTEVFYPGVFRLKPNSPSLTPIPDSEITYRSALGEHVMAPGDTVKSVVEISYCSKKDPITKSYGKATMYVKRFKDGRIYPYRNYIVEKKLKRLRKRLKIELVYVVHNVSGNDGNTRIIKAITNYDAINPFRVVTNYSVIATNSDK